MNKRYQLLLVVTIIMMLFPCMTLATPIPDTGQTKCYDNSQEIPCPQPGQLFYGQDAQYPCNPQSYTKRGYTIFS
jgi:vancomycin permeability regulator SanA